MRERLLGHRLAAPVVERILRDRRAGARRASAGPVRIVMLSAYGMGGTIRTVLNLAGHLAGRYEVEIVCVFRYRDEAFFDLPAGVRIHVLDDRRPGARGGRLRPLLARIPSVLMHPDDFAVGHFTVWTDVRLLRRLRSWRSGAVITTRPAFGLFAARFARAGVVLVAQEHLNLSAYSEELRRELAERYAAVDLVAALTRSDCEDYRRLLAATGTRVERVANAVPRVPGEPRAERAKVVLAA